MLIANLNYLGNDHSVSPRIIYKLQAAFLIADETQRDCCFKYTLSMYFAFATLNHVRIGPARHECIVLI